VRPSPYVKNSGMYTAPVDRSVFGVPAINFPACVIFFSPPPIAG
jgi:hypothetical protein